MKTISKIPIDSKHKPVLLNPNFKPLTVEKLKTFPGYENISESEANEVVEAIHQFALVLYGTVKNEADENIHTIDNQQVVYLNKENSDQNPVIPIFQKSKNKAA